MTSVLRRFALLTAVLGVASSAIAQDGIRNFLWVNPNFCTAGQPEVAQLEGLRAQGVQAVLNLRPDSEFDATEEAAKVRELGMSYYNIPVVNGEPIPDRLVEEFLRLTDDESNHPMFIHCASANRVGAFWLIRRVVRDGMTVADAQAEAEMVGLRAASLREFALDYISRHPAN